MTCGGGEGREMDKFSLRDFILCLNVFEVFEIPIIHNVNDPGSSVIHGKALETKCVPSPNAPT